MRVVSTVRKRIGWLNTGSYLISLGDDSDCEHRPPAESAGRHALGARTLLGGWKPTGRERSGRQKGEPNGRREHHIAARRTAHGLRVAAVGARGGPARTHRTRQRVTVAVGPAAGAPAGVRTRVRYLLQILQLKYSRRDCFSPFAQSPVGDTEKAFCI